MTPSGRESLAALRGRSLLANDPLEVERLVAVLHTDGRAGARTLADAILRRCEARTREERRLDTLLLRARALRAAGALRIAGVDEAGMGPLAGPVVAAAVVLPDRPDLPGLDDSKRLTPAARARLALAIRTQAVAFAVAEVGPDEIDRVNIYRAGLEAMRRAVVALAGAEGPAVDHLLVDARRIPGVGAPQTPIVHGDALDASIAAASILAKTHRDACMEAEDMRYPGYGFAQHKGYPTVAHVAALRRLGPCPIHRRSFAPVAACLAR